MSVSIAVPRDWAFVRRVLLVVLLAVLLSACGGRQKEAVIVPEPPPPPPEAEVVPEAPLLPFPELPEDGRVIVDASEYPWSAVGRVNPANTPGVPSGASIQAGAAIAPAF